MIKDIIENEDYKDLVSKQVKEVMDFLLLNDKEFSITGNFDAITFEPELPDVIKTQLPKYPLFILSNYTYSTIALNEEYITFEAGFGNENFGSIVKVPLQSVFQVILDESILFLNPVATVEKFNKNRKSNSMNVFKNNPNNKKFN
ncbi:hypothetical protein GCM10012288_15360 [Malaciobacter pacificus]|uniref:Uncharacterized protein n=1 Tax=Malaciobacter pacificus TaxID=1080223 RepID=A0A5C2H8M1_9BACT|nr:hypothetical protein [Malaciobacter pacificus]QEP35311.1 hypothetical protein APAC_2250 [Malaciobacter pacificus]GGD42096.1 hypothetical protein GCM10012288_15360 [Malaciobacter pacificus]